MDNSTEILTEGSQSWRIVGPLPSAVSRGVSFDNKIIMTGNTQYVDKKSFSPIVV